MSINLEEDKVDSLANANTNDIKELSAQVIKLRTLEDKLTTKEEELKKIKNDIDAVSIHISEPTRQAEISYAVFCLKKKNKHT